MAQRTPLGNLLRPLNQTTELAGGTAGNSVAIASGTSTNNVGLGSSTAATQSALLGNGSVYTLTLLSGGGFTNAFGSSGICVTSFL